MQQVHTYQITLNGIVQGVGFRPFIFNLATKLGCKGYVSNGLDGLKMVFNADEILAEKFYDLIINQAPAKATISQAKLQLIEKQAFNSFSIANSETCGHGSLSLTPDFALCTHCRNELYDPKNRRYQYPFITCTNCGPRYSILKKLPYDRQNTSMAAFEMCSDCLQEYHNPADRRFYSQSNSCPQCAVKMTIYDHQKNIITDNQKEIVSLVCHYLAAQKILAIKGIGGYLLLCDATNDNTVQLLRTRKHRPAKPFAVMFANTQSIENEAYCNEKEKEALESDAAPIVLLKQKKKGTLAQSINPNLHKIGVVLAYTPLLQLICQQFSKPIIATSGNVSGNPIIYDDQKALSDFADIADYIVINNRGILVPQDDSLVQFTPKYQQKIVLRRSRGYNLDFAGSTKITQNATAFGASMKATFAINNNAKTFVSQYCGDLESYETQENFKYVWQHYARLFDLQPDDQLLLADEHPAYFSSILANNQSKLHHNRLLKVQHHKAHFLAVLAENQLFETKQPVLGVIWDGTGYGSDGHIWGGEFFIFDPNNTSNKMDRIAHFDYFHAILGDKMSQEPRISALCLSPGLAHDIPIFKSKFNDTEWALYQKVLTKNTLKTSSVGRLFDGVASILGLIDRQSYEGQAAILLEQRALQYFESHGYEFSAYYLHANVATVTINTKLLIEEILQDLSSAQSVEYIAAKFHISLVKIIQNIAIHQHINTIAFSGGVFQNALLVDLIIHHLGKKYQLYFHKNFSPNDENIALGQIHYSEIQ